MSDYFHMPERPLNPPEDSDWQHFCEQMAETWDKQDNGCPQCGEARRLTDLDVIECARCGTSEDFREWCEKRWQRKGD